MITVFIGTKKKCSKCGEVKTSSSFFKDAYNKDGLCSSCKICKNVFKSNYKEKYPDRIKEAEQKRYARLKANDPLFFRKKYAVRREKAKLAHYKWCSANPDKLKVIKKKGFLKKYGTAKGKLSVNMASNMKLSLRETKAGRHWEDLVGYTVDELKSHLEKLFHPGMSWENHGKYGWHIDHKIPIVAFNYERPEDIDFKKCWALSNLQPLEASKNMSKQGKLEKPFQPSLCIGA